MNISALTIAATIGSCQRRFSQVTERLAKSVYKKSSPEQIFCLPRMAGRDRARIRGYHKHWSKTAELPFREAKSCLSLSPLGRVVCVRNGEGVSAWCEGARWSKRNLAKAH